MGPQPRVAVVTPELHRLGGTERALAEEVERWRKRFDLRILSSHVDGIEIPEQNLVIISRIRGPHLMRFTWWFFANAIRRRYDRPRFPPDVTMSPGANCLDADAVAVHMLFAKYWERVRLQLTSERRSLATLPKTLHRTVFVRLARALERSVYSGPALVWTASSKDAGEIERRFGRPEGSVEVVPHGVDATTFDPVRRAERRREGRERLGLESEDVLLLLVGNDLIKKGADLALFALRHLPPRVKLAIAGKVPPEEVRAVAERAGVVDRTLVLPHTSDPLTYYAAADILVAPSREDSFHLPAIEAMACGLPVVLSGETGVAELVTDGRDAIVLPDPSDVDAIVRAVERIVRDPGLAETIAAGGRSLAERCTWDANAERTAQLIERELRTPRIVVLTTDPASNGGIQRATRVLLQALVDLFGGDRVGVLAIRAPTGAVLPGRLLRAGRSPGRDDGRVRVLEQARYVAASMATSRRWRRRLALFAVHPHLAPVAWMCRLVSGAPYAVWCHGIESWGRMPMFVGRALRAADVVFAPSAFTARHVERVARLRPGSVRVIPHCVPPEARGGGAAGPGLTGRPVVLTVARLTPQNRYKGIDTLLYAWPRVLERVEATLLVVGDGPDLPRLRRIANALDLNGSVRFAGRVEDAELADAYATSAVFAMPARHRLEPRPQGEGFGIVYVEAGAAGLPVVVGRGAGAEDVVEDGGSGLLVDPTDPGVVADAIVRLLTDRRLARRLGDRGRELAADRFSYGAFREQVAALVRDLRPKGLW